MAVIQVEPGSKTVTGRLVDGSTISATGSGVLYGVTQLVVKANQTVRWQMPGNYHTTTLVNDGTANYINLPSGTTLAYRSV